MKIGDVVPDLAVCTGPGAWQHLSDWGARPLVLVFLRHLG